MNNINALFMIMMMMKIEDRSVLLGHGKIKLMVNSLSSTLW